MQESRQYLISFNDEWVPDHTVDELREKAQAVRAWMAEMKAAGVFVSSGGPFVETKEHLGDFAVVDVPE